MKNILIIAGSDSIGGAGIQADVKTCEAFDCYSATAITAITAQNTNGVSDVLAVTPQILHAQLNMIVDELLQIHAVKVGMLFNAELIMCVKFWLERLKNAGVQIIIDPVCVAKSGAKLLQDDALDELKTILPLATLITPNIDEAKILDINPQNLSSDTLIKRTKLDSDCEDTLYLKSGKIHKFRCPLLEPHIMHGAGCSFSTAIACGLANNKDLSQSITDAKLFITNAIVNANETRFGMRLLNQKKGV